PGRGSLRADEFGDVVERDDVAVFALRRLLGRHAHRKVALATAAADRHLPLNQALNACSRVGDDVAELGYDVGERFAKDVAFATSNETLGGTIEDADVACAVDADDPGARARQHGFREPAPAVDDVASPHDVVALRSQFLGHSVESLAESGEVPLGLAHRDLNVKIASRNDICGAD